MLTTTKNPGLARSDYTQPDRSVRLDALAFDLPPELEAGAPPEARGLRRDEVRLMISFRSTDRVVHALFYDIGSFLTPGDVVVINTYYLAAMDYDDGTGSYQIAATRGMEWSREERPWTAPPAGTRPARLDFRLQREVDTPGFVPCGTHIHTFTISRHGNATIEERLVSIAGEGVELAVATDHNHQLDYRPWQEHLSLNRFFTPVTGNEVTTANGHFNAFPLDPRSPVPDHRESEPPAHRDHPLGGGGSRDPVPHDGARGG